MARDESGAALPLRTGEEEGWMLAAVSGGSPITILGEWDGGALTPLGVVANATYYEWRPRTERAWLRRVS